MNETIGFPSLRGRCKADAAIVGGGLSGLTIGLWLAKAGMKVAVVEAARMGSGATAACAGTACLAGNVRYTELVSRRGRGAALAYFKTQQAALQSLRKISPVAACTECQIAANSEKEHKMLIEEAQLLFQYGLNVRTGQSGITVPQMLAVHMPSYWSHLLSEAKHLSMQLWEHSRVTSVDTSAVYTADGSVHAPYVIVATGFPIINTPGWFSLKVMQRERWTFIGRGDEQKTRMIMKSRGEYVISRTPWATQLQLWEGSVADETFTRQRARSMMERRGLPPWTSSIRRMEAYSMDGLPFIGHCGAHTPNLFVAAAYGGSGLLGSMMAAHAISALILGLPSDGYDIYQVNRRTDWHMPYTLGKNYLSALMQHAHAPRCPHMGCPLVYDPQGKRWQCPCHGAQFDDIGRLVTGPAVRDADIRARK